MCDRDPLPRWSHGRVTLLGDAAHPMYPVGSNGASQAILDARALADQLRDASIPAALTAYERERLPMTAQIVQMERQGRPGRRHRRRRGGRAERLHRDRHRAQFRTPPGHRARRRLDGGICEGAGERARCGKRCMTCGVKKSSKVLPNEDPRSVSELFAAATDWSIDNGEGVTPRQCGRCIVWQAVLYCALELTRSDHPRVWGRGLEDLWPVGSAHVATFPEERSSARDSGC